MTETEKNRPGLMVLGGLSEFVPLVTLAGRRGIRTVCVDGNPDAPAKKLADAAYTVDVRDTDGIARIAEEEGVSAITTAYSDLLLECMVRIAEKAGLPCHLKTEQLPCYRDKLAMHALCAELGIRMPAFRMISGADDGALPELSFPMILKPRDLYGSRSVKVARSLSEAEAYLDTFPAGGGLAEEYIPDPEYNVQCWVRRGTVRVLGIADREKTPAEEGRIPVSTRNVYPARKVKELLPLVRDALQRYIGRTGQTEGPLCMQCYYGAERGLTVGEIAGRFLGYEHELLAYACGMSTEELRLAHACGTRSIDELLAGCRPEGTCSAGVLYFHARDGVVADQSRLRRAAEEADARMLQCFYREGERIGDPQARPYAARIYLVLPDRESLDRVTGRVFEDASVTDAEGRELLYRNRMPLGETGDRE